MLKEKKERIIGTISRTGTGILVLSGLWFLWAAASGGFEAKDRLGAASGAILALFWAMLLVWTDRDRYHRKGVYFLTGLAAMGFVLATVFAYDLGIIPAGRALVAGSSSGLAGLLFMGCYRLARGARCGHSLTLNPGTTTSRTA